MSYSQMETCSMLFYGLTTFEQVKKIEVKESYFNKKFYNENLIKRYEVINEDTSLMIENNDSIFYIFETNGFLKKVNYKNTNFTININYKFNKDTNIVELVGSTSNINTYKIYYSDDTLIFEEFKNNASIKGQINKIFNSKFIDYELYFLSLLIMKNTIKKDKFILKFLIDSNNKQIITQKVKNKIYFKVSAYNTYSNEIILKKKNLYFKIINKSKSVFNNKKSIIIRIIDEQVLKLDIL